MSIAADVMHADPTRSVRDVPLGAPWTQRRVVLAVIAVAFIFGSFWGLRRVEMSLFALVEGWPETLNLIQRMWPPFIPADDRSQVLSLLLDTFFMAFLGTFIGVVMSVPLGLLSSRHVARNPIVRGVSRGIIAFARAVPSLVFALIFVRVFGIGPIAGILAIGLHSIGFCGKLFSAAADNIELGPRDGVASTGASRLQELLAGVWPQMIPSVIATSLYRAEINFREGTLIGLVGGGGIGLAIRGYQGSLRYQELLGVTLVVIVAVIAMELLSQAARRTILGDSDPFRKHAGGTNTRFSLTGLLVRAFGFSRRTRDAAGKPDEAPATVASQLSMAADVPLSPPWNRERVKLAALSGGVAVCTVLSFILPDIDVGRFVTSLVDLPSTLLRLVPSNLDFWTSQIRSGLVETIAMGLGATFMAMLFALPLSFLAASNVAPNRVVFRVTRFMMIIVRATPELVLAVLFVAALGLGPRTGTLALAVGIFGFSTRLFADTIEEARSGPREGVISTGATRLQDTAAGVAPQVWPALVSQGLYIFDVSLRASTVLGIVGAGGIGFMLSNSMRTLNFEVTGGIVLCIFVIVGSIEVISNWVNRQIT
jgi:phosphonate transport system permease protein